MSSLRLSRKILKRFIQLLLSTYWCLSFSPGIPVFHSILPVDEVGRWHLKSAFVPRSAAMEGACSACHSFPPPHHPLLGPLPRPSLDCPSKPLVQSAANDLIGWHQVDVIQCQNMTFDPQVWVCLTSDPSLNTYSLIGWQQMCHHSRWDKVCHTFSPSRDRMSTPAQFDRLVEGLSQSIPHLTAPFLDWLQSASFIFSVGFVFFGGATAAGLISLVTNKVWRSEKWITQSNASHYVFVSPSNGGATSDVSLL